MNLNTFYKHTGESDASMATKHGFNQPTLWRIRTGKVVPRPETAARIETATGGLVTAMELLYPEKAATDTQAA